MPARPKSPPCRIHAVRCPLCLFPTACRSTPRAYTAAEAAAPRRGHLPHSGPSLETCILPLGFFAFLSATTQALAMPERGLQLAHTMSAFAYQAFSAFKRRRFLLAWLCRKPTASPMAVVDFLLFDTQAPCLCRARRSRNRVAAIFAAESLPCLFELVCCQ